MGRFVKADFTIVRERLMGSIVANSQYGVTGADALTVG
jgi:hypothetical protein